MQKFLSKFVFITVLLLTQRTFPSDGKRNYGIKLFSVNAAFNKAKVNNLTYDYVNQNGGVVSFSAECSFKESVPNYRLLVKIQMLRADNTYMNIWNVNHDGCNIFSTTNKNGNLLKVFEKELKRSSNFLSGCPIQANKVYYLRNLTMGPESFSPYVPRFHYIVEVTVAKDKINYINAIFKGAIYKV